MTFSLVNSQREKKKYVCSNQWNAKATHTTLDSVCVCVCMMHQKVLLMIRSDA